MLPFNLLFVVPVCRVGHPVSFILRFWSPCEQHCPWAQPLSRPKLQPLRWLWLVPLEVHTFDVHTCAIKLGSVEKVYCQLYALLRR